MHFYKKKNVLHFLARIFMATIICENRNHVVMWMFLNIKYDIIL